MRRRVFFSTLLLLCAFSLNLPVIGFSQVPPDLKPLLDSIKDPSLHQVLNNSIEIGLISSPEDFNSAVANAENRQNEQNPNYYSARGSNPNLDKIRQEIARISAPITAMDKDSVEVRKADGYKGQFLFESLANEVPPSFKAAYNLGQMFNPKSGTNDHIRLDKQIDEFLASIEMDPVIQYALKETGTEIKDLKQNWFGAGLGFEHVVVGEVKGSTVSGYHWWYKFYLDERAKKARVVSSISDQGDNHVFTGKFTWDPDLNGPLPEAKKKIGGFILGNSVQAILALGHIAIETSRRYGSIPGALTFNADINGVMFTWQLYTMGKTIRSLYPMGGSKTPAPVNAPEDFYELEGDLLTSARKITKYLF